MSQPNVTWIIHDSGTFFIASRMTRPYPWVPGLRTLATEGQCPIERWGYFVHQYVCLSRFLIQGTTFQALAPRTSPLGPSFLALAFWPWPPGFSPWALASAPRPWPQVPGVGTLALGPWPWDPDLRILASEPWPWNPGLRTLVSGPWSWDPGLRPPGFWNLASWPPGPGLLALAGGQTDVWIYLQTNGQTKYP